MPASVRTRCTPVRRSCSTTIDPVLKLSASTIALPLAATRTPQMRSTAAGMGTSVSAFPARRSMIPSAFWSVSATTSESPESEVSSERGYEVTSTVPAGSSPGSVYTRMRSFSATYAREPATATSAAGNAIGALRHTAERVGKMRTALGSDSTHALRPPDASRTCIRTPVVPVHAGTGMETSASRITAPAVSATESRTPAAGNSNTRCESEWL
jgi:hypothetical protein